MSSFRLNSAKMMSTLLMAMMMHMMPFNPEGSIL